MASTARRVEQRTADEFGKDEQIPPLIKIVDIIRVGTSSISVLLFKEKSERTSGISINIGINMDINVSVLI